MYLLTFQYNYTPTRNAKRFRLSQTLVSNPEYIIFGGIKITEILQRFAAATERFSWEINFPKMLRELDM